MPWLVNTLVFFGVMLCAPVLLAILCIMPRSGGRSPFMGHGDAPLATALVWLPFAFALALLGAAFRSLGIESFVAAGKFALVPTVVFGLVAFYGSMQRSAG
jgi:hypothetical protein